MVVTLTSAPALALAMACHTFKFSTDFYVMGNVPSSELAWKRTGLVWCRSCWPPRLRSFGSALISPKGMDGFWPDMHRFIIGWGKS